MAKKKSDNTCNPAGPGGCGCPPPSGCKVEAVLSIDERGQMVLPKDVREKAGIQNGEKLALISWERNGAVCCLALMKAQYFSKFTSVNFGKSSILSTSDQPNGRRTETNETNLSFFRIPSQTNSRKKSKRNKSSATVLGPR